MNSSNERGFTLIEVLVTLVILSVGVLALGGFSISSLNSGQISRERITAVHLAEQLIEAWQKTDALPPLDINYCQTAVNWAPSTAKTISPCPTSKKTTTSVATCIPRFGTKLSYTITTIASPVCGPPKTGGNTFSFYSAASPPITRLVKVSWSHKKGKTRSIFLTHISRKVP